MSLGESKGFDSIFNKLRFLKSKSCPGRSAPKNASQSEFLEKPTTRILKIETINV